MNRLGWVAVALLTATFCYSQDAHAPSQATAGGVKLSFPVILEKTLDSKKLKQGDPVSGMTAGTLHGRNGLLIPSGSKVIGHVTEAQARGKGDANSTLGFVFDKIQIKSGAVAMKGTLQAIAPSLGSSGPNTGPAEPGSLGGAGRGDGGRSPGTTPPASSSIKISGADTGTPLVNTTSTGVMGIKGLEMDANGLITSAGKQVKLDNGTQLMIRAEIELPAE